MRYVILVLFCFLHTIICEDYYDILGIQKDAENREIRKAFKKLALKYHPDKNQDKDAHENFLAINKAYEVLKDEEMRKKYDLYGEEGLKEDFGKSWQGNYRSWNYYYESFGIYDDDPEIITLSRSDFDRSVLDSPDIWFINFYSPQCSHCHHLAPAWRKLARELQGVIQIGAVNCEEDWMLCRQQNIFSYPSLMIYPQKRKYKESREAEDMIEFVLKILPYNVITLTPENYVEEIGSRELMPQPWLIFSCMESKKCFPTEDLKKLGVILDHLVYVAELEVKEDEEKFCNMMPCDSPITYFENLIGNISDEKLKGVPIEELDTHEIVNKVLHLLPEPLEISTEDLEEIRKKLEDMTAVPWLIKFIKDEESSFKRDIDLKRLKSYVPEVRLGYFNCYHQESTCKSLHIFKHPTFLLFRPGGSYEFHYGGTTAFDVTRFAREALSSQVHTLNPEHFPTVTQSEEELWFIDFFAPWCPPCMQFLPEWRKASSSSSNLIKFGTVDCSVHSQLCRKYNINSYPSAILYKKSVGHKFHGSHSQAQLIDFVQDILNPVVVSLTPTSFEQVKNKPFTDVWVIDFFAPWCGPCQQLAPQWRKFAKMVLNFPNIHVGEVDCQAHQQFCNSVGVNSYPTIRLYPTGSTSTNRIHTYSGWSRDASSLQAWVFNFMPSKVQSLSDIDFHNVLADDKPWVIDFFAPWCSHCQTFAPEFEKIAQKIEGKVKAGKVNCDQLPRICRLASIRAYPTVLFYRGQSGSNPQNPTAEEIHTVTFNGIISFLQSKLNLRFQNTPVRDEL